MQSEVRGSTGPATGAISGAVEPDEAARPSLRALAMRGTLWIFIGYLAGQAVRFGSNLILARLLFPEAFGLMAIINVVLQGLDMFSDIGLGPSIVQNKRGDEQAFLNTAWTIQVGRGIVLWIITCLLAWPLAVGYGEPLLAAMMPVAGLVALISGFYSTALFSATRHLALGRLTILDLASQAVMVTAMISWAMIWPSVWALLVGGMFGVVAKAVLSQFWLASRPNWFAWDRDAVWSMVRFGKWIFVSTILTFLATHSDRLVFGGLVSMEMLGVYSIALMFALFSTEAAIILSGKVIFPAYSRLWNREVADAAGPSRSAMLMKPFRNIRLALLSAGGMGLTFLLAAGPLVIDLLYDARYREAGWMLQILAIGAWFRLLECSISSALLAMGKTSWLAAGSLARVIGMAVCIPIGWLHYGFPGAIAALVVADAVRYVVTGFAAHRQGLPVFTGDVMMSAWWGITGVCCIFVSITLASQGVDRLVSIAVLAAAAGSLWLPLAWMSWRAFRSQ